MHSHQRDRLPVGLLRETRQASHCREKEEVKGLRDWMELMVPMVSMELLELLLKREGLSKDMELVE